MRNGPYRFACIQAGFLALSIFSFGLSRVIIEEELALIGHTGYDPDICADCPGAASDAIF